jgi:hypothetical protein
MADDELRSRARVAGSQYATERALRSLHHELGDPPPDPVRLETEALLLIHGLYLAGWYLRPLTQIDIVEITPLPGSARNGAPGPSR